MNKPELKNIPVEKLTRGKYQPRQDFDQLYLQELSESIKENGVIQPIIVRSAGQVDYEIIAGECRWRAAQLAGLNVLPCLVRNYSDEQAIAAAAIENLQRKNLNPIEEAKAYQQFIDGFNYLHEEIAAVVGKSRTVVTNSLRLLKLNNQVQELLIKGELSEGHGKVLVSLSEDMQYKAAQECIVKSWSVRELEQKVKVLQKKESEIKNRNDPNIIFLEKLISDEMGSEAKLETNLDKRGGWLKIRYFDNETLAGILDKMGVKHGE